MSSDTQHPLPSDEEAAKRLLPIYSWQIAIERWSIMAHEVEHGYSLTIFDYLKDLDLRSRLQRLMEESSPGFAGTLKGLLADADTQFHNATFLGQKPFDERMAGRRPGDWWHIRIPKIAPRWVRQYMDDSSH